ncbi:MAG: regulatory protein RecX [Deltaproteobacteria bacterium]|nr:regulatory protein RecX [Deltaproteobacteria bacterium]
MSFRPPQKPPKMNAWNQALGHLARRDHGQKELREKLLQRGHSVADTDEAIAALIERGWLNDARTAQNMSESLAKGRGYGPRKVMQTLVERRKLSSSDAKAALTNLDEQGHDWRARADLLLSRRRVRPDDPQAWGKLARFLASRGFPQNVCAEAARDRLNTLKEEAAAGHAIESE